MATARGTGPLVVLVTGASSGIGLATAVAFAEVGDHLVLVARGEEGLERAAQSCRDGGAASVTVEPADISDAAAVERVVTATENRLGRVDVVVNSAGVVAYGRLEDVPPEVFEQVVRTNVVGTANVARATLPGMRRRDAGHLILLGSLIGQLSPPYMSTYAVTKWAVRSLARSLRIENRDRRGVHITHVSPGGVDTPIYLQAANFLGPVGRPPPPVMKPEVVAAAIVAAVDRPRSEIQVGTTNGLFRLGFSAFPALYDAIVTPIFEVAAIDRRQAIPPTTGNVLRSGSLNRLRGQQGSAVVSVAANTVARLRIPRSRRKVGQ